MSRIDYPTQDEINRQIEAIIQSCDMFEDDLSYNGFTELKPIQKKNKKAVNFLKTVVSIAAVASLIVLVKFVFKPVNNETVQPLKENVNYDAEVIGDNAQDLQKIELDYVSSEEILAYNSSEPAYDIDFEADGVFYNSRQFRNIFDIANCGAIKYNYPVVQNNMLSNVEKYYLNVIDSLKREIYTRYLEKKMTDSDYEYASVSYMVNDMYSVNDRLLSFTANEQKIYQYSTMTESYNNRYAQVFDVVNGTQVQLAQLFEESDKSINYIYARVKKYYENAANDIADTMVNDASKENYLSDSSWYLTSEGIVFFINNMYHNDSSAEKQTYTSEAGSLLIKYSDLYSQGISFNSTYIDYTPQ